MCVIVKADENTEKAQNMMIGENCIAIKSDMKGLKSKWLVELEIKETNWPLLLPDVVLAMS